MSPLSAQAQTALPWHALTKPVMVEEISKLNVWVLGHKAVTPLPANPYVATLVRASLTVPQLVKFTATPAAENPTLSMIATAPMSSAILIRGLRVEWETKTMRNARIETPLLDKPVRIEAGKAVLITYSAVTGVITLKPL